MKNDFSKLRLLFIGLFLANSILTAQLNLIPRPQSVELGKNQFVLSNRTAVNCSGDLVNLQNYFALQIKEMSGISLRKNNPAQSKSIVFQMGNFLELTNDESYKLSVQPNRILLSAKKEEGLFRGIQTLIQLIPSLRKNQSVIKIPCCEISDSPRFGWRGLNLDCGRHFMSKDFIKRYIDILARYKFNIFHWHLTDDQGWRIEIKKYPKLTSVGAWRKEADGTIYGGFYTQPDIKEIVEYARSRFITVIPEIEMPGHSLASLAAYPENSCSGGPFEVGTIWGVMKDVYCAGNDSTFIFLQNVLSEVCELFPSEYIHIGGDEVPKDRWKVCPKCQARIKTEGLKDENELQAYFIKRISDFLATKGKKIIGWDEILEGGLPPAATVQSWQSFEGAINAAKLGHYSISSPASHTYLNADADNLDIRACYSFDPVPPELNPDESKFILGSEVNMWTEQAPQEKIDSKLFPRILALAEVFWTNKENKNYDDFYLRVQNNYDKLNSMGIEYGRESKAILFSSSFDEKRNEFRVTLKPGQKDLKIYYTTGGKNPDLNSKIYRGPVLINKSATLSAAAVKKEHFIGSPVSLSFTIHKGINSKLAVKDSFSEKYSAGGLKSLVDGIRGTNNFHDGQWQGYEEVDFNCTSDLGRETEISKISVGALQDVTSWIFFPTQVDFYVSPDNKNFKKIGTVVNEIPQKTPDAILHDFSLSFDTVKTRYIKVIAKNIGKCPAWHPGAGGKSWIFVDELIIE